jgi:hypothetical protein
MSFLNSLFRPSPKKKGGNRRSGKRFQQITEFEVSGVDADGQPFQTWVESVDLSGEGGCLRLSKNVEADTVLTLKDKRGDIFTVQVCWRNYDLENGKCIAGFKVKDNHQDWMLNIVSILGSTSSHQRN